MSLQEKLYERNMEGIESGKQEGINEAVTRIYQNKYTKKQIL